MPPKKNIKCFTKKSKAGVNFTTCVNTRTKKQLRTKSATKKKKKRKMPQNEVHKSVVEKFNQLTIEGQNSLLDKLPDAERLAFEKMDNITATDEKLLKSMKRRVQGKLLTSRRT